MYCSYFEEQITEEDCAECERDCSQREKSAEKVEQRERELERLRSSDLALEIKQCLAKSLNLDGEKIDQLIVDLFNGAFVSAESQLKICLNTIARQMAIQYVEVKAKKILDTIFEKALQDKVCVLAANEEALTTKIREIILNRTKKFFAEKGRYNDRNKIESSLDKAVEKVVDSKVSDALDEITKEAIDKFNKEAMKKMMLGMVGAIQNDKRLLAVLDQ